MNAMVDIALTENGHSGSFSAHSLVRTLGTLTFHFSGPLNIVVDSLDIQPGLNPLGVAYKLLDALHEYVYYKDCKLRFSCPKARAMNDQQIEQEHQQLATHHEKVA